MTANSDAVYISMLSGGFILLAPCEKSRRRLNWWLKSNIELSEKQVRIGETGEATLWMEGVKRLKWTAVRKMQTDEQEDEREATRNNSNVCKSSHSIEERANHGDDLSLFHSSPSSASSPCPSRSSALSWHPSRSYHEGNKTQSSNKKVVEFA